MDFLQCPTGRLHVTESQFMWVSSCKLPCHVLYIYFIIGESSSCYAGMKVIHSNFRIYLMKPSASSLLLWILFILDGFSNLLSYVFQQGCCVIVRVIAISEYKGTCVVLSVCHVLIKRQSPWHDMVKTTKWNIFFFIKIFQPYHSWVYSYTKYQCRELNQVFGWVCEALRQGYTELS